MLGSLVLAACTSSARPAPTSPGTPTPPATTPPTSSSVTGKAATRTPPPATPTRPAQRTTAPRPNPLPLRAGTGTARQAITVVAPSPTSTTARLQTWRKDVSGWHAVGTAVTAHLGSNGLSSRPSESRSATPVGSFTLTQAFGALANPGTALPYVHTDDGDWWISQPGPLYNTRQHCSGGCAFTQGDPNEHLRAITPQYNYAVVIDYNRFPVHQGAGSAFFLHVTDGSPTAGCVAIPQSRLVSIMKWLDPAAHPRIVIGVA